MLLQNKVVLISGVGPGLGQALAHNAAREGAKIVLLARTRDFLDKIRGEIVASGGEAIAVACDITRPDQCEAAAQAAAEQFGRIDGLVNSAFIHGDWSGVADADEQDWQRLFDVNCMGALRLTKACLPYLGRGSAIVNVSTMATMRPYGDEQGMEMGYAVAKGGLNVLGKYMASDLGKRDIRVNTCRMGWMMGAPVQGFIDSEVAKGRSQTDVIRSITHDIPLGIVPAQEDCARAVLMLLSDFAAVVTGASIDVNGGHWMAP